VANGGEKASESERRQRGLFAGLDKNKDQSYFLYRVTEEALQKTLLPVGELTKPEVREQARKLGLATADKKDSQGICFVGKIGIKEFLQNYVEAEPGDIVDKKTGKLLGQHDGAIFYTIGQRHGLHVGGGLPFYVVGKDMSKNVVYVTTDLNDENLWRDELNLSQLHWINDAPLVGKSYSVRTRYRAALIDGRVESLEGDQLKIHLDDPERALTAGQSTVLYDGDRVVGGGIVV
jgi:tRNA-specific 2-thiouridylase